MFIIHEAESSKQTQKWDFVLTRSLGRCVDVSCPAVPLGTICAAVLELSTLAALHLYRLLTKENSCCLAERRGRLVAAQAGAKSDLRQPVDWD